MNGLGQLGNARNSTYEQYCNALYGYAGQQNLGQQNLACTAYVQDGFMQGANNVYFPPAKVTSPIQKKEKSMFKEIVCDVKGFILEHRSVIYFLAFALLVDHFVFRGAFKARLQGCVDRLVTKVEEKIQ